MAKAENMKALSAVLRALMEYDNRYILDKKEQAECDKAIKKVYDSLVYEVKTDD